jgi:hypothetical protein
MAMKMVFAITAALMTVNLWDQNYNHGALTRTGFSLAYELARWFSP